MYAGLLLPANLNSSSRRNDWKIASEAKVKMLKKHIPIRVAIMPQTMAGGIGWAAYRSG